MHHPDMRWVQRLSNFNKALSKLNLAVELTDQRALSDLEKLGVIHTFEFTHELAWNVMKDYFEYQGNTSITGSRDAIREAFHKGLVTNGDAWMETINSRNQTSHTYNEEIAHEIAKNITTSYIDIFLAFQQKMERLR